MAALCHVFPGYTIATLRDIPIRDLNVLIDVAADIAGEQ